MSTVEMKFEKRNFMGIELDVLVGHRMLDLGGDVTIRWEDEGGYSNFIM